MPLVGGTGNRLLTTDKVAKDMLLRWKNNLVLTKSVYRDLEPQFGEIGDTINVKLPNNVIVNSGATATTTTPLNDKTIALQIDTQKNVKFSWTMKDKKLSINEFGTRYLEPAANRLANIVDISVATAMGLAYTQFGTVGSALSYSLATMGKAYARDIAIPDDALIRLITNTIDNANLTNGIAGVYSEKMVKEAIQKGYTGQLAGFDTFYSQNLLTHTNGKFTPASASIQVKVELSDGSALQLKGGLTSGGTIKKGDRFTIAGVYEINPITHQTTGRLQTFVITADAVFDGSGFSTTAISPAINDGTNTVLDGDGNAISTAMDQNVSAAALVDAVVTFQGDAEGIYRENFIMHRNAIAMAVVFLDLPASGHGSRARDPQTGLALSVSEYFDGDNNKNNLRLDILWGVKLVRPDLIMRATCQKIN